MNETARNEFRAMLLESRAKLLTSARGISGEVHAEGDRQSDELDAASADSRVAFIGRLRERERVLIHKIDAALARIDAGTYGECVACGDSIGLERLRARPVATLCIDCKQEQEAHED
jgi:DnaK suppressor protein